MWTPRLCVALAVFSNVYVIQTEGIVEPAVLVTAKLGDDVTLQCFYPNNSTSYLSWYKQTVGQRPRLISSLYKYREDAIFHNEFKDHPRLTVQGSKGRNHLTISNLQPSDSATYYCGRTNVNLLEFEKGIFLILKGSESKNRTIVQQPVSEPVQPGDSVTLQCTIDTETCAGEHSVYWFRQGSGESSPGVIYTHGNSSDQCERSSGAGSPTQSCVYTLPKRNLSPSDSGTYYCAVATCGEILFGNGTKMDLEGSEERKAFFQLLVSCLAGALVLCLIIIGVLIGVIRTGKCCEHCKGVGFQQNSQAVPSDDLSIEQNHDMEPLNYAALNFTNRKSKTGRKVREMESDTLYSNMRLKDCDGNFR